jgi:membrane protease YdiL (CAAX protease family)
MLYDLLVGFVIAFLIMGFIYLAELALGWTKFDGFAWQVESSPALFGGILTWLLIFIIGGWSEELLSRGYHLQNLADGLNLFWGVLISSSVFALLHFWNPDASWISTLGILLAGFFLALPYLLTRQLWLSIGLHIGWNFFEGVVFGFPVSGLETYRLLRHTVSGPGLWTGGAFGPEAGLLVIPAMLLGSILVYAYTRLGNRSGSSQP